MSIFNRKKNKQPNNVGSWDLVVPGAVTPNLHVRPLITAKPTSPTSAMATTSMAPITTPGRINLVKSAGISLVKANLMGERLAMMMALDKSGSMVEFYASGLMQQFSERVAALGAHVDDDGDMPVWALTEQVFGPKNINLAQADGFVAEMVKEVPYGGTKFAPVIRAITAHYRAEDPAAPGYVVFQTDGDCGDYEEARRALIEASDLPIIWVLVGFGDRDFAQLKRLHATPGRKIVNTSFWWTGKDPASLSDEELFAGVTTGVADYLVAARKVFSTR